jgi:serine phosphatase RsbU (regulator of sigma subunit)
LEQETDREIERLRRQVARLARLVEASRVLNSALPEDTLISTILGIATEVMDAEASAIILRTDGTGAREPARSPSPRDGASSPVSANAAAPGESAVPVALDYRLLLAGRPDLARRTSLEDPGGHAARVIREGAPLSRASGDGDGELSSSVARELGLTARSILCVPLRSRDRVIGAVEVVNKKGAASFDDHDIALFTAFADHVGTAMRNAQLYAAVKKRALERKMLLDLERQVIESLDVREVMTKILELTEQIVRYDAGAIFFYDLRRGTMRDMVSRGYAESESGMLTVKLGEGIAGWAASTGESVIVRDVRDDPHYKNARPTTRSEMAVPLKKRNTVIGVFNLESDQVGAYTEADVTLIESFANHAAIALDNARLHEEATHGRQLRDELKVARRIQQRFLPKSDPTVRGFEVSGRTVPSKEVGGDYYDFIWIGEDHLALVIADVAGKGVPAGLILASFRASLITETRESRSPSEILANVNFLLSRSTETQDFVTSFLGVLDIRDRQLVYTNAGHNWPYLLRRDGRIERLETGGPILGIMKSVPLESASTVLGSGDLLVLFTDGITEAMNRKGEQFGEERLEPLLASLSHLPASEIRDAVFREVSAFVGRAPQSDDQAIVVVKAR